MKKNIGKMPPATVAAYLLGTVLFLYFFLGFMVRPCLNTLTSIFTTRDASGKIQPFAVIKFFFAGNMSHYVFNSLKLAICLSITVNIVGVSLVLLTEYFDIKGAGILRVSYMTTLVYGGVALAAGYLFLYGETGIFTTFLMKFFPDMRPRWFTGFPAVLFTMTFACTSNHMLFFRNSIRGIDYNTVEAARNMGAKPLYVLFRVVLPTQIPTLFSLTVMTFITGLCAMSAPQIIGYDAINPEIVRLAGSSVSDEAFPQARAALLSIILAMFTIILLTVLTRYERKGHYLSVSKTKAKLVKQKISNPVMNVLVHIYAYVLFVIYSLPVIMIILFSFQEYGAITQGHLDFSKWTLINYFGTYDFSYTTPSGKIKHTTSAVSGLLSNPDAIGGIQKSTFMSICAAVLACVIVVVACAYIFKHRKTGGLVEYALLFPWLLPSILICYSYRIFFNSSNVWYVFGKNLYYENNVIFLVIMAYAVIKIPFALRMTKASFYSIDNELEEAARNLGSGKIHTFLRVKLPIILPSVLAVLALVFNQLFSEYDMSVTFQNPAAKTLGIVIKQMTEPTTRAYYNLNAKGRQCAATVVIMIVAGIVLYLVYGVGSRDLAEKLAIRDRRKKRLAAVRKFLTGQKKAVND